MVPTTVHVSAEPAAQATALRKALGACRVPGVFLYQGAEQARRWLVYHESWSPSRGYESVQALYGAAFDWAAHEWATPLREAQFAPSQALHLVGLGCGGGQKDAALLAALQVASDESSTHPASSLHYSPLDGSAELVEEAAAQVNARLPAVTLHPLVADLAAWSELRAVLATQFPSARRMMTCFGIWPNWEAATLPGALRSLLRPGELLLLSANLSPAGHAAGHGHILAQYDNAPARAWYSGALEALGLTPDGYALHIGTEPLALPGVPGLVAGEAWQITVHAEVLKDVILRAGGADFPFATGKRLSVFQSNRFTPAAVTALLAHAGLQVSERWEAEEEGVYACGVG